MVLLQTLVTSVILSMIAVMVMKWVLGRYMLAARNYRSSVAKVHANGYAMQRFSSWNVNFESVPTNGSTTLDGKNVTIGFNTKFPGDVHSFVVTSDEDQ